MNWYYVRGGSRNGPIDDDALKRLIAVGELKPSDLVWNDTMGSKWVEAFTVPGLFTRPDDAFAAAAAPLPQAASLSFPGAESTAPGQTPNRELTARARASLSGQWGTAVAATAIYMAISIGCNVVPSAGLLTLLIAGPLYVGSCFFFLALIRSRGEVGQLFVGFKQFGPALGTYLLMVLYILLWTLLLIIPGIIMSYAYMMAFFVRADDPAVGVRESLRRSKEMMRGHKWKLFCLYCRFIGWSLLALLTCGVGYLWLIPYVQTAMAHFYEDVRPRSTGVA